jgi:hypothetical protein
MDRLTRITLPPIQATLAVIPDATFLQIFDLVRKVSDPGSSGNVLGRWPWFPDPKARNPET